MPGSSFSLPARTTCPGLFLHKAAVCSLCYAGRRGRYAWRIVREAQERRLAWTLQALEDGRFVPTLAELIAARGDRYFRLHDSGDLFLPLYVESWCEIALALPHVSFWAPTRSWALAGRLRPDSDPLLSSLRRLALLPNVTVRPSALLLDAEPPVVPGLHAGSAVTTESARATCPKYLLRPPACGDCRRCWDERGSPVTYLLH